MAIDQPRFPTGTGILPGLGLGGFFDGIVPHRILQWHHMATSAGYPPHSVENLQLNTQLDRLFHTATYLCLLGGLVLLWRAARPPHALWPARAFLGTVLMGFGLFNLCEGTVNHQILGIHHVNETVPRSQWIWWDMAFLLWGAAMLVGGWTLWRLR
ncbi:DUF2243 domain-containing protein [Cereibacter sphaeroides]|uniref:DUF2243 domain-containing protein n=1 Tax=Cereibacter sphaeroides TaxID=1063 RepID=UPI000191CC97|nr:DUF2243 domain-containing protein [Cereibacter sphaeroides]ACM03171.1 Hypothetical Protein RSKD131_3311 [Cereibacter sphaeroides KD131]